MSGGFQPIMEYSERALDILSPLSVLGAVLRPGVSISADSPNRNPFKDTNRFIHLAYGSSSYIIHKHGLPFVIKKLHPHFDLSSQLVSAAIKEAKITAEVFKVFNTHAPALSIPIKGQARNLPNGLGIPTPAIKMDLIYPLPKAVGRALIQQFHPRRTASDMDPYVVEEILNQYENNHCLVQPCLGLDVPPRKPGEFSINSMDLSLPELETIGIDTRSIAGAIGEAFALLHYRCELSSGGVQFAFGTSPTEKPCPDNSYTVGLYLFDFGGCERINIAENADRLTLAIVDKMLEPGVRKFIPSPLRSPALYKIFKDSYVEYAKNVIDDEWSFTPHNVMTQYEIRVVRLFL
ncbi:hypothetical protein NCS52_00453500 [Fusarium sp. LHS14.1]|nr:hypothetical protein NCS52_00453500 [Fusarium sp. LHS14.1]